LQRDQFDLVIRFLTLPIEKIVPWFQAATKKFTQLDKSRLPHSSLSIFFGAYADYTALDIIGSLARASRFNVSFAEHGDLKGFEGSQEAMNRTRLQLMRSLETSYLSRLMRDSHSA
jgi:hypothetical protein